MQRVAREWGSTGFVAVLVGVAVVAIGISAVAMKASWGWVALLAGVVLVIAGGGAMAAVTLSRRRSAWKDRGQRDPVLGEEVSAEEERKYLRRYRGRRGDRRQGRGL